MQITRFDDMYIAELQELRSLEGQLGDAMLRVAEMASHPRLKTALMRQREQAQVQEQRLETLLSEHEADPRAHIDQAMQALIGETEKMLSMVRGNDLRDAALIASAQKVCHYQIAAYGTVASLAGQLELRADQELLHRGVEEAEAADLLLSRLAKSEVNQDALVA